jgi:beta-glucosidase
LVLDKVIIDEGDTLTATIEVKNTGAVAGAEVVQFYISDIQSSIKRPFKELAGFAKVHLNPSETKSVSYIVDKYAISFFDEDKSAWIAERGSFAVLAGTSSANIKAEATFELSATYWWSGL